MQLKDQFHQICNTQTPICIMRIKNECATQKWLQLQKCKELLFFSGSYHKLIFFFFLLFLDVVNLRKLDNLID